MGEKETKGGGLRTTVAPALLLVFDFNTAESEWPVLSNPAVVVVDFATVLGPEHIRGTSTHRSGLVRFTCFSLFKRAA